MLYQETKAKNHLPTNVVLDYHKRRKLKKTAPKNSLYIKSKTTN